MSEVRTRKRRRKRRKLKIGRILLILIPVVLLIVFLNIRGKLKPASKTSETVVFTVEPASTVRTVTDKLEEQGIIRSSSVAYYYAKFNRLTDIVAGDFNLDKSWTPEEILKTLTDPTKTIRNDQSVTIIEGDWAKHIAEKVAAVADCTEDELLALWNDETYIRSIMDRYPFLTEEIFNPDIRIALEGYFAPNTYMFLPEMTAREATEKILDQSLVVYDEFKDRIAGSGLSIHELYTLASIVQYESGKPDDMRKIAGVFMNRLSIDMPLQSSVTVCYAIDVQKDDDWMACEVNPEFDSPYNTYQHGGLPPGPIENPGTEALLAVLEPDDNPYLFFMADVCGSGEVYYAETLEEHEANVERYLNGCN